jgi:hypothetical protein
MMRQLAPPGPSGARVVAIVALVLAASGNRLRNHSRRNRLLHRHRLRELRAGGRNRPVNPPFLNGRTPTLR